MENMMTTQEKTDLIMMGMAPALITRIDGLGWTHKQAVGLIKTGFTPDMIKGCLDMGATYADIKKLVDEKKWDNIETAIWNSGGGGGSAGVSPIAKGAAAVFGTIFRLTAVGGIKGARALKKQITK